MHLWGMKGDGEGWDSESGRGECLGVVTSSSPLDCCPPPSDCV